MNIRCIYDDTFNLKLNLLNLYQSVIYQIFLIYKLIKNLLYELVLH